MALRARNEKETDQDLEGICFTSLTPHLPREGSLVSHRYSRWVTIVTCGAAAVTLDILCATQGSVVNLQASDPACHGPSQDGLR